MTQIKLGTCVRFWSLGHRALIRNSDLEMASIEFDNAKSLVKFTNPILVMNKAEKGREEKKRLPQLIRTPKYAKEITADRCTDTQEILNCILPPREWEENGQIWREQASYLPSNTYLPQNHTCKTVGTLWCCLFHYFKITHFAWNRENTKFISNLWSLSIVVHRLTGRANNLLQHNNSPFRNKFEFLNS